MAASIVPDRSPAPLPPASVAGGAAGQGPGYLKTSARLAFASVLVLILFAVVAVVLRSEIERHPRPDPALLVGKPLPDFFLSTLNGQSRFASADALRGQAWLLHVWASWCTSCEEDHRVLARIARQSGLGVVGVAFRDDPQAAQAWLGRHETLYTTSLSDPEGALAASLGIFALPQTFLVDSQGMIRFEATGALAPEAMNRLLRLLPARTHT